MLFRSFPSQYLSVNTIHTSNPKGNQQYEGKNKGQNNNKKKGKDGKGNENKSKEHVGEGSKDKNKFPCKLFTRDHLTHLFNKI